MNCTIIIVVWFYSWTAVALYFIETFWSETSFVKMYNAQFIKCQYYNISVYYRNQINKQTNTYSYTDEIQIPITITKNYCE